MGWRLVASCSLVGWLAASCNAVVCNRSSWCEGDELVRCSVDCKNTRRDAPGDCERTLTRTDCAADEAVLGTERTCVDLKTTSTCIDAERRPCEPVGSFCNEQGALVGCTSFQGELRILDTRACDPGKICHAPLRACVDAPVTSCDVSTHVPGCVGEADLRSCTGRPDAGFVVDTRLCVGGCEPGDGGAPDAGGLARCR